MCREAGIFRFFNGAAVLIRPDAEKCFKNAKKCLKMLVEACCSKMMPTAEKSLKNVSLKPIFFVFLYSEK